MAYDLAKSLKGKSIISLEEDKSKKVLILGVGNYLMGDEGVGVHIMYEMEELSLPEYVDVLDGGTGGFFLMNYFDIYPVVIFVDATIDGQPPGTVTTLRPEFASDFPTALSVHDVGLKDMIEAIYLQDKIPDIHLITISVTGIQPMTMDLTKEVEESVPLAIKTILSVAEKYRTK
jgi:hydrogenase maturation protease